MGQRCTEARGRNHHLTENFALHSTQQQLTNTHPSPGPPLSPSSPPSNIELSPSLPFSYYRFRRARHFRSNYGQFAAFLTGAGEEWAGGPGHLWGALLEPGQAQARARTNRNTRTRRSEFQAGQPPSLAPLHLTASPPRVPDHLPNFTGRGAAAAEQVKRRVHMSGPTSITGGRQNAATGN